MCNSFELALKIFEVIQIPDLGNRLSNHRKLPPVTVIRWLRLLVPF